MWGVGGQQLSGAEVSVTVQVSPATAVQPLQPEKVEPGAGDGTSVPTVLAAPPWLHVGGQIPPWPVAAENAIDPPPEPVRDTSTCHSALAGAATMSSAAAAAAATRAARPRLTPAHATEVVSGGPT